MKRGEQERAGTTGSAAPAQAPHAGRHGRHSGSRTRRPRFFLLQLLFIALGATATVIAWGYLVKAAIDFGVRMRDGHSDAWLPLSSATLGAVACLFVAMILVARAMRLLGVVRRVPRIRGRRRR